MAEHVGTLDGKHKQTIVVDSPCHPARKWRLLHWICIPFERYERACPECGKRWEIQRESLLSDGRMTVDQLTIEPWYRDTL